ncbi:uncharacterized protein LOC135500669 [Lineus longissimus]|uniref:uncharacterized protein LOC135500669 n=1 Tax=Lineus longissimus TaxID=88925 RepID=UPI002B4D0F97
MIPEEPRRNDATRIVWKEDKCHKTKKTISTSFKMWPGGGLMRHALVFLLLLDITYAKPILGAVGRKKPSPANLLPPTPDMQIVDIMDRIDRIINLIWEDAGETIKNEKLRTVFWGKMKYLPSRLHIAFLSGPRFTLVQLFRDLNNCPRQNFQKSFPCVATAVRNAQALGRKFYEKFSKFNVNLLSKIDKEEELAKIKKSYVYSGIHSHHKGR